MTDSQQRHRRTIAKGIYADQWGLAAKVQANGLTREKRFPPDTKIKTIKNWQGDTKAALRKLRPKIGRGTFAADVETYVASKTAVSMPTINERKQHLALWVAEFGPRNRHSIETIEINTVLSRWMNAGLAASTVNNRRTALQALWTELDGKAAPNPVDESEKHQEPDIEARALSYATIRKILDAMPNVGQGRKGEARDDQSKTKARLRLIAYTGLPHKQIKQLRPQDVNLRAGTLIVSARRKGKGVERRSILLTAEGLEALRHFADLDCWGSFSNSSVWKSWRRACKAAGLTTTPRPYDLRHSFGTQLYVATGDTKAVSELMMHAPGSAVVHRYTMGGVAPRLRLAVGAFDAAVSRKNVAVRRGSTR